MADSQYDDQEDLDPDVLNVEDASDPAAAAFEAFKATVETLAVDLIRETATIRNGFEFALDKMEQRRAPVAGKPDRQSALGTRTRNRGADKGSGKGGGGRKEWQGCNGRGCAPQRLPGQQQQIP
ncbi:DUF6118 family protein [Tianweitania populi]|uniref:Uncharacterized protein n=1 Tax=Tianweitania populi TaxID=1607949 RepID=A0A8J3DRC7_9HYPH|nr:DUF6118 family protein [Tianweitania populi]GHD21370.1 hypothetical protein GCM10016234_34950 [Tianweitania populi]